MTNLSKSLILVCPIYEPYSGGGGQYFPIFVESLKASAQFKKIIILTEYHSNKKFVEKNNDKIIYRVLPRRDSKPEKNKIYWFLSYFITYGIFYTFIPYLTFFHKIKYIHFTRYISLSFFLLVFIFKKLFNLKIVLDMRTTVEKEKSIKYLFGVNVVISNSEAVYNQMLDFGISRKKNILVPNPLIFPKKLKKPVIKTIFNNLNIRIDEKFILFVGQFVRRKSIFEVINAFIKIHKSNNTLKLILVGRNMLGQDFTNRITNNNILVLEPQPRINIVALMERAEIIVQPSKVEGIPRVSLEALSLGKKVLLPACVPEFKKNNSFFIENSFDSELIANRILKIINSKKKPTYNLTIHSVNKYNINIKKIYSKLHKEFNK